MSIKQVNDKDKAIKKNLELWYKKINKKEFIQHDPVQFPHMFSASLHNRQQNTEIAAFISASIAWGRRDLILRSCNNIFQLLKPDPFTYIMSGDYGNLKKNNIHRTFFESDLLYFCRGLKKCYTQYNTLESLFASVKDVWNGLVLFRETMAGGNKGLYTKHIASALSNSACKRLNLSLRWLVRKQGPVDLGLWNKISPASLFIPLDLHVGRISRQLGLLDKNRMANDKKAVIALTERLRAFCPEDPVKYDLAMFGMGIKA